ncbi:MAG TPA: choice-of-anchor Q domain-containing protein, partial [Anaerolineae bacterium]|nr:choice-of-anchor Q domain-containing protein [Anaerolineae bacterium]
NQANTVGGGISNQGTLTITAQAQVYYNLASRNGGGIYQSSGNTTIISSTLGNNTACCVLSGGSAGMGGGIYNSGGTVTLRNALVDSNSAYARGGGILNFDTLMVDRSTISRNVSDGADQVTQTYGGGGIYNFGNADIVSSTIRDNRTYKLDGGGFYNGWYANATLSNVTLRGNRADEDGGGLKNNLGIATLTNVTFSGNMANADGGGVYSDHGQTNLRHVTFSGNSAANGGGIYNLTVYTTRTVTLQNTILANSPASAKNCSTFPGSQDVVSQGYNLSDDDSLGIFCPMVIQSSDQNNTNPRLGVLANNGGPTTGPNLELMLTHLPIKSLGSPAIDQILPGFNGCNTTFQIDQRGVRRPQGIACDIGSVEYRVGDMTPWVYLPLIMR